MTRRGHRAAPMLTFFLLLLAVAGDLNSDTAALLALRAAVSPSTLRWSNSSSACLWPGVVCGAGRVTELHLPGAHLSGAIPAGVVGNLTALRILSLRHNNLSGNIPADIAACTELRSVSLNGNRLSGGIPDAVYNLSNLIRVDLSNNLLAGEVSPEIAKLTRLRWLYMENNNLSGELPDIAYPPAIQRFNVSFNNFSGEVPAGLRRMPADAFLGMAGLCGAPLTPCPSSPSPSLARAPAAPVPSKKPSLSAAAVALIAVGAVAALLLLIAVLCIAFGARRFAEKAATETPAQEKKAKKARDMPPPGKPAAGEHLVFVGGAPGNYGLEDLLSASAMVLGKGVFGTTYKATLADGTALTVKRLKDVHVPEKDFRDIAAAIGAVQHPNVLPLQSYYYGKEKLLVHQFVGVSSLSALIHGSRGGGGGGFAFPARLRVAVDAARGIEFVHSTGAAHGGVKASNVIVDERGSAVVSDHGIVRLVSSQALPRGGAGYRAPEVTDVRNVSQKADVYGFGVVLLELLTGKEPRDLPAWVRGVPREDWAATALDADLDRQPAAVDGALALLQLGVDCTKELPDARPTMADIVERIEGITVDGNDDSGIVPVARVSEPLP